jgi:hypothetical protein
VTNTDQQKPTAHQDTTSRAKSAASSASEEVKERAQDVAGKVSHEATRQADKAKGALAGEVKDVASALRTAADEMRDGSPQERTFSQIADGLADASEAMRNKDLGEVVGTLNDFARRNPLAFLGGAALLGFAATRFAKASGSRPSQPANPSLAGMSGPAAADPLQSPAPVTTAKGTSA